MAPSKMSLTPIAETKQPTMRFVASIPSGPGTRVVFDLGPLAERSRTSNVEL
jgi:hypothetical protein